MSNTIYELIFFVETKLNIQKVANLRIMEDEKIDMENINYQGGDEYVLIIIEKS